jgi:hypothetical protein
MSTITEITNYLSQRLKGPTDQNAIPEKYLPGLDPEWRQMWLEHGQDISEAHLVTVEEFHKCPKKYSFTYPTWTGMSLTLPK